MPNNLCVHIGFPKTATTTFQRHVFPAHSEIEYLGKYIPGFGYRSESIGQEIGRLITRDSTLYAGSNQLRDELAAIANSMTEKLVMISSESFVQEQAADRGVVAQRLWDACGNCRIIITIREQLSMIRSFVKMHGRYGQYLFLAKEVDELFELPLSMSEWLRIASHYPDRNFVSTIRYAEVADCYARLFGRQNVGIFLYEELVSEPATYVSKLASFLHIDAVEMLRLLAGHHENRSTVDASSAAEMARTLAGRQQSRNTKPSSLPPTEHRSAIVSKIERLTNLLGGSRRRENPQEKSLDIQEPWLSVLREQYRDGNRRLVKEWGLPLAQYGYIL